MTDNQKVNIVIFGSTGLIGSNLAKEIAKRNVNLILHGKSKKKLEKLNDEIIKIGEKPLLLNFDVENDCQYKNLGISLQSKFKQIDFYINAIGFNEKLCPLTDLTFKEWDKLIEINLSSNWKILKEIEPLLKNSKKPKIIFFSNSEITKGLPYYNALSVSKAGLKTMINIFFKEKEKFSYHIEIFEIDNLKSGLFKKNFSKKNINESKIILKQIVSPILNLIDDHF